MKLHPRTWPKEGRTIKGSFTLGTFADSIGLVWHSLDSFEPWCICVHLMNTCMKYANRQLIARHSFVPLIALTIRDYTACSLLLVSKVNHHHCHPSHVFCWTNDIVIGQNTYTGYFTSWSSVHLSPSCFHIHGTVPLQMKSDHLLQYQVWGPCFELNFQCECPISWK